MSVLTVATAMLPAMIGNIVDMPKSDLLIIETPHGFFTIHETEVKEYFYA